MAMQFATPTRIAASAVSDPSHGLFLTDIV